MSQIYLVSNNEFVPSFGQLKSRFRQDAYIVSKLQVNEDLETLLRKELLNLFTPGQDVALLKKEIPRGAFFFDMDGTVIEEETINELAQEVGKREEVARITELAMQGKLNFAEALHARVALLKGLETSSYTRIFRRFTLTPGIERLTAYLKKEHIPFYLVSGGFTSFALPLAKKLGFKGVLANELEIHEGRLTGRVSGSIVDEHSKKNFLEKMAYDLNLKFHDCTAIGDGANDLPMLTTAGLAVGFRAKKKLFSALDVYENSHDFLLHLLKNPLS